MGVLKLKVVKCPTDELAVSNCAVVNRDDLDAAGTKHVVVSTEAVPRNFIFTIKNHPSVRSGEIAFASVQRQWAALSLAETINVQPFTFKSNQHIASVTVSCDFQKKKDVSPEPLDTDLMAREFSMQFGGIALTVGEKLVFQYADAKGKTITLALGVKSIEGIDLNAIATEQKAKPVPVDYGQLLPNSAIIFDKEEGAQVNLIGKAKGKTAYRSIINPDWDFQKMGIGGLDAEFTSIFRRAFASRVFPPEFIEQLGMKHVRGILLYGPPGTGKTLMARQIGKMLNAREPKIVNGPQILDKYVGESESNIRKLFADAEEEWKRCGSNSALHMIIFDEIDAICKQRGSMAGSSSVHDTVVNQLLSKMDGVEQLNNILVIGMTNRKDMIDEALLRPGRLEVQVEISLPDEAGRLQILNIHTARMREYKKLDPNVNVQELAANTKNFSGAELEGLVRAAQSSAMNRLVKAGGKVQADPDAIEKLMVNSDDFAYALENDVKPAFGRSDSALQKFINRGLILWGNQVHDILNEGRLLVDGISSQPDYGFATGVLIGARGSGTSCLAAHIAKNSDFPFVKVVDPADFIGFSETAKCQALKKSFGDACRSKSSVLLIDSLERLVDYTPVGPRFSNLVLQTLLVMLNQPPPLGHRLLVLATSSSASFLRELELDKAFGVRIQVPSISMVDEILRVASSSKHFSNSDLNDLKPRLTKMIDQQQNFAIGIKILLLLISLCAQGEEGQRGALLYNQIEAFVLQV